MESVLADRIINAIAIEPGKCVWVATVIAGELFRIGLDGQVTAEELGGNDFSFFIQEYFKEH